MVMATHIEDRVYTGSTSLLFLDSTRGRQSGLDYRLRIMRKHQKQGTLKRYPNEFNLIDEKLCQWKDSS